MLQPLDGPATQGTLSITDASVVEAKVGASALKNRKVVTVQPIDGKIYVYFGDDTASAPNSTTVGSDGLVVYKNAKESFEAGQQQPIYLLSVSGTVNVKLVERA